MRLLITTQAVDLDDPVLSFFHDWLEEFAREVESVEVVCLKEGRHALPKNVRVHSLGKEEGRSRLKYVLRLYRYAWSLRKDYDVVFVHMNPEYFVLAGWIWNLLNKKTALWYIHPHASWRLRKALKYADMVFSASQGSFPIRTDKLRPVGIGVDTDYFAPATLPPSSALRVMCAARIAPVKNVECMIDAVGFLAKRHRLLTFDYYGEELPRDAAYAERMREKAQTIAGWTFKGGASTEEVRDAYRTHDIHVNATVSGSYDKAVFEAMACGCIPVASNKALAGVLPRELIFEENDCESLARTIEGVMRLPDVDKEVLRAQMRKLAVEQYSLRSVIQKIVANLGL